MRTRAFFTDVRHVFRREVLEFRRKPALLVGLVAGPLALMLLFGFVFPSVQAPTDVPFGIAIVDDPAFGESEAPAFVAKLEAANAETRAFRFREYADADAARAAVESKEVRGFFLIPEDFTEARRHGGYAAPVHVYYDQGNPTFGRLVAAQAELLVGMIAKEEGVENVRTVTHLGSDDAARALMDPYAASVRSITGAPTTYFQFLVPGIVMLTTMTSILLGLPNAMSRERDAGTLDAILASPVTRQGFLVGKLAGAAARGVVQMLIVITLGVVFFGVRFAGSGLLVAGLAVLSLLAWSGFALVMAALMTPTSDATRGLRAGLTFPMLFLSGVLFPVESLPQIVQPVSRLLPLTYGVDAMRQVVIVGADATAVLPQILILAGFGAVGLALAVPLVKRYDASV